MKAGTWAFARSHARKLAVLAAIALAVPLALAVGPTTSDGGVPAANKTHAAGATVQKMSADVIDSDQGLAVLTTTMKTGKTDLVLQVSLECALWTTVRATTIEDHADGLTNFSRAEARVVVWVEVDGVAVKVAKDDTDGKVVFCDRVHEQEIQDRDESTGNWTMRQYLATRTANAFNWVKLDVGTGLHTIVVKVDIEASNTPGSFAEGAVGKRTLVVDPVKFATGTTI